MIRSLDTSVSGLITLEKKQANINNNIANANTIGFKTDNLVTKSFDEVMIQNKDKVVGGRNVVQKLGTISLGSEIDTVSTSFYTRLIKNIQTKTDFCN